MKIQTQQLTQYTLYNLSNLNQKFQQLNIYYNTNQYPTNHYLDLETGEIYQLIEITLPHYIYILSPL